MQIGYIGLGKMGKNMVLRLHEQGVMVVAWNRSAEPKKEVAAAGVQVTETIEELIGKLETPRVVWLMLPAGQVVDEFIAQLTPLLSAGDLVIDGGNSFYKDSLRRSKPLNQQGIHFMDIGVSGGPKGARDGACLMIVGEAEDFERVKTICMAAAAPNAFARLGPVGAGHFAKMVHNGIEYGMMEALAEGTSVLKNSQFEFDLAQVMELYNRQSVITSRLVGWAKQAFDKDPTLENVSSQIGSGGGGDKRIPGEADWTVGAAHELGVQTPVIEDAIKVREDSSSVDESSPNGFRNKVVSVLRGEFGQHDVKKENN